MAISREAGGGNFYCSAAPLPTPGVFSPYPPCPPVLDASVLFMWIAGARRESPSAMTDAPAGRHSGILERLAGRPIVFVGLMGAGKTAIGRRVASELGVPFLDSDHEIESASRMTIPDLFERYGEPEFRALEQRVIVRLLTGGTRVLATGGGAYMSEETRRAVAEHALSVWLKADLDTLMGRVGRKQNRPLLKTENPRATMEKLMATRYPVYALADITVQTRDDRREVIATEVLSAIDDYLTAQEAAA
jgi:shikimate kinase